MKEIIRLLMRRDGMTYAEAKQAYLDCRAELVEAIKGNSCLSPEDVLLEELGLEPDYTFYFF